MKTRTVSAQILLITALLAVLFCGEAFAASTVTGTVRYQDRKYTTGGFTGVSVYLPVRFAEVDLIDAATMASIGSASTDLNGAYSITTTSDFTGNAFLRVYAMQDDANYNISVRNNDSGKAIYTAKSADYAITSPDPAAIDIDVSVGSGVGDAFNIFDVTCFTIDWVRYVMPNFTIDSIPEVILYWQSGSSDGTYYDRQKHAVFILGMTSDSDSYDDDILYHELAHYMVDNLSLDQSPAGGHTLTGHYDLRLSWSEGVAHWISSSIRRWVHTQYEYAGRYAYFQYQVDNFNNDNSSFDLEAPSFPMEAYGSDNELSIASMLWDISDRTTDPDTSPGTDDDSMELLPADADSCIWTVMTDFIPFQSAVSFEDFWDGFQELYPDYVPGLVELMGARSVKYYADYAETNDTYDTATILGNAPYTKVGMTFHGAAQPKGDVDWFSFLTIKGNTYVIETVNLGNGCDSVLEVYNGAAGAVLATNDDRIQYDQSSMVTWTAPSSETYYILVHPYNDNDMVANYGNYDVKISLKAQGASNDPPTAALTATPSTGTAPLTVALAANAVDTDGYIISYAWDLDGDGQTDYSSPTANELTYVYYEAGSFSPTIKITDDYGNMSSSSAPVTVTLPAGAPTISASALYTQAPAPLTVSFSADVSFPQGTTGSVFSYEWDFESDGVFDQYSGTTAAASFVYTIPGVYIATLKVTLTDGSAFLAETDNIAADGTATFLNIVTGPDPAAGVVPMTVSFSVAASEPGYDGPFEWDLNGDGNYDIQTVEPTLTHTFYEPNLIPVKIRAHNATLGLTCEGTVDVTAGESYGFLYMISPVQDSVIYGNRYTLTVVSAPQGLIKNVMFQFRESVVSSWTNIGSVIISTDNKISTTLDLTPYHGKTLVFRALINGASPSQEVSVSVSASSATSSENTLALGGAVKEVVVDLNSDATVSLEEGIEVYFPYGGFTGATEDVGVSVSYMTYAPSYQTNGAATDLVFGGTAFDISISTSGVDLGKKVSVKVLYADADSDGIMDGAMTAEQTLKLMRWDEPTQLWEEVFGTIVNYSENYILFETGHLSTFALFAETADSVSSSSHGSHSKCMVGALATRGSKVVLGLAILAVLAMSMFALRRKR